MLVEIHIYGQYTFIVEQKTGKVVLTAPLTGNGKAEVLEKDLPRAKRISLREATGMGGDGLW